MPASPAAESPRRSRNSATRFAILDIVPSIPDCVIYTGQMGLRVLAVIVGAAVALYGQTGAAELFGTVYDRLGGAVPNAALEAVNTATGARFATHSSAHG